MEQLKVTVPKTEDEMRMALDAALLLGFQTESATFPIASRQGTIPVPATMEELQHLWKEPSGITPEDYRPAKHQGEVYSTDFRKKKGLECLFGIGPFLKDQNADFLPDTLEVKMILPGKADISTMIAACNVAFRLGMETTGYEGSLLAEKGYQGNVLVFENQGNAEMRLEERPGAVCVHVYGTGKELEQFSAMICENFPKTDSIRGWKDILTELVDDFTLRGADGQLAWLHALQKESHGRYTVYGSPELTAEQKQKFPETIFYDYKSGKRQAEKTYEFTWEVDDFRETLRKKVYPLLNEGDTVRVEGCLSEDKSVRNHVVDEIRRELLQRGAVPEKIQLISAYKQGFSWLDEVVIPAVKEELPQKITIFFRPFLPEGMTEWVDENGAVPSYHNVKAEDPEKWYDLPIRYLQELYPIADVLEEKLGISKDDILFQPYEGKENLTYLCQVSTKTGQKEFRYLAHASERPYLEEYPEMGKVHPSTGYINVWINGRKVVDEEIRTDLEKIWDVYQKEVLPDCGNFIEKRYGEAIGPEQQPFFRQLTLEVWVSEPDEQLGCREDLFSSLDAFHEDLYFTGCDYFKQLGLKKAGMLLDAPGLILPVLHKKEGPPVFRVTLEEPLRDHPCILRDQKIAATERSRDEVSAFLSHVGLCGKKLMVTIKTKGVPDEVLAAYAELLETDVLELGKQIRSCYRMRFCGESGAEFEAEIPERKPLPKKDIAEIDLHESEVIGYETYLAIIEELKQVEGMEVFQTASSYLGRKQYAIWLKPEYAGYLSMTKRLSRIPGLLINARHHANEVSSTNASFQLLKKLLTENKYRDLPEKLNLVLVPMENPDGAAIHYELQKEHPFWKFHVARFNALGKEFAHEYYQQDTIHSEAMGMTRLIEMFAPDMIVDNHGVPSHEWEQQFSGYTSPSYKGFWLPRSLLYGYFWYVSDPEYQGNYPVNEKMQDVIADRILEDSEMTAWNKEWSTEFERYAHAWFPKLFPADYYKGMINYWIPYPYNPNHTYASIRYPWVVTVSYTSEVADETAQGEYLELCASAHVAHDEATLTMLIGAKHGKLCRYECRDHQIFAGLLRQRPMIVEENNQPVK